jgi:spore germination cell wall hydrolase CwlJ-like protein
MRVSISKVATWAIMSLCVVLSNQATATEVENIHPQVLCLAKNIYYEAGNESFDGKVAVAQVTLNRVEHQQFPETVCGVVQQRTRVGNKTICQFSWVCEPVGKIRYNSHRWQDSLDIARNVMRQGLQLEELENALYFHATHVNPNWGLERLTRIGNHIFYSETSTRKRR